jgi:ribosomal protein S18 acetylase RimI-like enzyme
VTNQSEISYRPAKVEDSADLAAYIRLAGDGLYEFLLDDLIPTFSCEEILKWAIGVIDSPLSYRNCYVGVNQLNGQIVGMINMFPADQLAGSAYDFMKTDRWRHVEPVFKLQDVGSLFVNALAVSAEWKRQGIGAKLLELADSEALTKGLDRISLHVWSDNKYARAFYETTGFSSIGKAGLPRHPDLPNKTCSILMRRKVDSHSFSKRNQRRLKVCRTSSR